MASRMSETPEEPGSEKPKPIDPALSRRDFLRRAGLEAVKTGQQASPMNLARAAVGLSTKTPWWKRLAEWRGAKEKEKTPDDAPADE